MNVAELISQNKGTIVDVRTADEFRGGHVAGSINIPVQALTQHLEELKALEAPLILCCASGGRSGMAHGFLSQQGISCLNGGSWMDVNYYKSLQA
jgi:phage shock protein E